MLKRKAIGTSKAASNASGFSAQNSSAVIAAGAVTAKKAAGAACAVSAGSAVSAVKTAGTYGSDMAPVVEESSHRR